MNDIFLSRSLALLLNTARTGRMSTKSAHVTRKVAKLNTVLEKGTYLVNRNPRNLEKLCIAYKPDGFHLDAPGKKFWNK